MRAAVLGGEERSTLGDRSELVGGDWEMAVQQDATLKVNLGDVLAEAVVGTATFKADVKLVLDSVAIELGLGATEPVILGSAFQLYSDAHVHLSASPGNPTSPPTVLMAVTPGLLSAIVKAR